MDKATTLNLIKRQQRDWSVSRGIDVAPDGRVKILERNFFACLHSQTEQEITLGDGGELGRPEKPGKMYSLWSSSALACNVFDYWRERPMAPLLNALDVMQDSRYKPPQFEQKFPTGVRNARANLDVLFCAADSSVLPIAIESKFSEPYQSGEKKPLSDSYFAKPQTWEGLSCCCKTAENLAARKFGCLDAGQLLKHILGLTLRFGKRQFLLLYLWYEVKGSEASDRHSAEVAEFSGLIADEVLFRAETYQNLFWKLSPAVAGTPYEEYLRSRYLAVS